MVLLKEKGKARVLAAAILNHAVSLLFSLKKEWYTAGLWLRKNSVAKSLRSSACYIEEIALKFRISFLSPQSSHFFQDYCLAIFDSNFFVL